MLGLFVIAGVIFLSSVLFIRRRKIWYHYPHRRSFFPLFIERHFIDRNFYDAPLHYDHSHQHQHQYRHGEGFGGGHHGSGGFGGGHHHGGGHSGHH